MKFNYYKIS